MGYTIHYIVIYVILSISSIHNHVKKKITFEGLHYNWVMKVSMFIIGVALVMLSSCTYQVPPSYTTSGKSVVQPVRQNNTSLINVGVGTYSTPYYYNPYHYRGYYECYRYYGGYGYRYNPYRYQRYYRPYGLYRYR